STPPRLPRSPLFPYTTLFRSINLAHFEIDSSVIKLIPADVARKYNILPVNKTGATVTIAMADPTNVFAMDDIKFMTGYNVEPVRSEEHTSELQSRENLVCRLL